MKARWLGAGVVVIGAFLVLAMYYANNPAPPNGPISPRHRYSPPWNGYTKYLMVLGSDDWPFVDENMVLADLRSSDKELKRMACDALGTFNLDAYEQALPDVLAMLDSEDHDSVMAAVPVVGKPQAASEFELVVPRLAELYENSESSEERSKLAKAIVGVCASPTDANLGAALGILIKLLDDEDDAVSKLAAERLGNIGPKAARAIPKLLQQVRLSGSWNRRLEGASIALGKIGQEPGKCVPAFQNALQLLDAYEEPFGRSEVIEAIGGFGHAAKGIVPRLRRLLVDDSVDLHHLEGVVETLRRIDPVPAESMQLAYDAVLARKERGERAWKTKLKVLLELRHASGKEHRDKLRDFRGVRSLVLPVNTTDADVRFLAALPKVRSITQEHSRREGPPLLTDNAMQALTAFRNLESLTLFNGNFTNTGVAHIAALRGLKELHLADYLNTVRQGITDDGLLPLKSLVNLTKLTLELRGIDGTGVGRLKSLEKLRDLSLRDSGVRDGGLVAIVQTHPNLERLNLNHTQVTAKSVDTILSLRKLRWLGVYCSRLNGPSANFSEATKLLQSGLSGCYIMWND